MRERLRLLLNFAIFWIGVQIIIRGVFLWYNHDLTAQLTTKEILLTFAHGLKMDVSITGYFLAVTSLVLAISVFYPKRWLFLTLHSIMIFVIVASGIILMVDMELYRHWGFRLDTTPIFYVAGAESEAMGSVKVIVVIKLLLVATSVVVLLLFAYTWWLQPRVNRLTPSRKRTFSTFLIITALMFIPIRGSLKVAPMNTGFVYFHKSKVYANHAAINVVWNFLYSLSKKANIKYPENFFDRTLTEKHFSELYPNDDSTKQIFTVKKPNIILIILESFTADVIEPLGGVKDVAPNFNKLCTDGILFTNFYSTGDRTDKGVVGILSGYPAQPITNIIKYPAKTEKLAYLPRKMKALGYHTKFIHGGNIDFANFRSYFTNSEFDQMTTLEDFPDNDLESKWGIHDEFLFDYAAKDIDTTKAPHFTVILTLSSHEPFDVPSKSKFTGTDEESLFLNSVHYSDSCLGTYINHLKQTPSWDSTVVILVADHGHRQPGNKQLQSKERFRIPMLITGGAVKIDSIVTQFGSQTDIANTLLGQLDKPSNDFRFSKNLFSPHSRSFAQYFFNNGYGYVDNSSYVIFDNTSKQFLRTDGSNPEIQERTKAYQQTLYLDYNRK